MPYLTVSIWKMSADHDRDAATANIRDNAFPALKALGAIRQQLAEAGDSHAMIVTEWPDEATRSAAMEKVNELRSEAASTVALESEFTGNVTLDLK